MIVDTRPDYELPTSEPISGELVRARTSSYPVLRQYEKPLNWIYNHEDKLRFDKDYPLSRLYPYFYEWMEFNEELGQENQKKTSWIERVQAFINYLTDVRKGKNLGACYYIALTGRLLPETSQTKDEKPSDYRRFTSR